MGQRMKRIVAGLRGTIGMAAVGAVVWMAGCQTGLVEHTTEISGYELQMRVARGKLSRHECARLMKGAAMTFQHRVELTRGADAALAAVNRRRKDVEVSPEVVPFFKAVVELVQQSGRGWNPFGLAPVLDTLSGSPVPGPEPALDARARVTIPDTVRLKLDRLALSWAVDGAAETLIKGGVETGQVRCGDLRRFWGDDVGLPPNSLDISAPGDTVTVYQIKPRAGALAVISRSSLEVDASYLKEAWLDQSRWREVPEQLVTWGRTAFEAAGWAEVLILAGRRFGMERIARQDSVGVVLVYPSGAPVVIETDPAMSQFVDLKAAEG